MFSLKVTFLVALSFFGCAQAFVTRQGQCPVKEVQLNFNLTQYLGVWYEIQRYEADFQVSLDCVTAEYTLEDPNVARLTVVNAGVMFNETTGMPFEVRGAAVPSFPEDSRVPAKFSVAFFGLEPDRSNYWVLGSDYNTYSVVWSCEQVTADTYNEFSWVLSREKEMTPAAFARVYSVIAANNIAIEDYRFTEQSVRCYLDSSPY